MIRIQTDIRLEICNLLILENPKLNHHHETSLRSNYLKEMFLKQKYHIYSPVSMLRRKNFTGNKRFFFNENKLRHITWNDTFSLENQICINKTQLS